MVYHRYQGCSENFLISRSSASFQRDFIAGSFQTLDIITGETRGFETVEEVATQILVSRS